METLPTDDGLALRLRRWNVTDVARGTVILVHGLGDHCARYEHVAARVVQEGWNVVAYDQRGHGRSPGRRGVLQREDDLLRDLACVVDRVRETDATPAVLLGHSMGGLVVSRFVAEGLAALPAPWYRPVGALALSSPALDPGMHAVQRALLAVLGPLWPTLQVGNGLKPAWVSRDPEVVRAYRADPLVHDRICPRLARFIVDAGVLTRERAARWHVPTLLMWAGADRCVAPRGSARFAAEAPQGVVRAREFAPLYHEIFNEPERAEVLDTLGAWLQNLK